MDIKKILKDESGIALIIALLITVLITTLGTAAILTSTTDVKIADNFESSLNSFYIAEAGIQRAIGNLNSVNNWIDSIADLTDAFSGDNSLGNGTYVVQVSWNDPAPGDVRLISTGRVAATSASSTVEVVVTPQPFNVLNWASFSCGDLQLDSTKTNEIKDGDVYASGNLYLYTSSQITNGDGYAMGNLSLTGSGNITGGNAFANGNVELYNNSVITGNATAGSSVVINHSGQVDGTSTSSDTSPYPVTDLCDATNLHDIAITREQIDDFIANATETLGSYTPAGNINKTGIVVINGGDFILSSDATFADNVIFIIDGGSVEISGSLTSSPAGSTVTILVTSGNFYVKGGGSIAFDGVVQVGTVDASNNITGGNFEVLDNSNFTVNGSAISLNGNTNSTSGGDFQVNYQAPSNSNLMKPGSYAIEQWLQTS